MTHTRSVRCASSRGSFAAVKGALRVALRWLIMADIVLFGAGQIAQVAKVYVDAHGPDRVVGFTVDAEYLKSDSFHGLPLVPWERLEDFFPPDDVKLLGPLSYRRI